MKILKLFSHQNAVDKAFAEATNREIEFSTAYHTDGRIVNRFNNKITLFRVCASVDDVDNLRGHQFDKIVLNGIDPRFEAHLAAIFHTGQLTIC